MNGINYGRNVVGNSQYCPGCKTGKLNRSFFLISLSAGTSIYILLVAAALAMLPGIMSGDIYIDFEVLSENNIFALAGFSWFISLGIPLYLIVVALIFIYKAWSLIQDGYARATPGEAVGFLFIPLFNCYWIFQALWGFSRDYNRYIARHAIRTTRLPEGLFLACSIVNLLFALSIIIWIAFTPLLPLFVNAILFIIMIFKTCETVDLWKKASM